MATSLLAVAFALSSVYAALFGTNSRGTFPYVITGLLGWFFVSGAIVEAVAIFTGSAGIMQVQRLPLTFHVMIHMERILINMGVQLLALWGALLILGQFTVPNWTLIPGVLLLSGGLFWTSFVVGMISARFRDIGFLTGFVVQFLFFITPIFWEARQLPPAKAFIAADNPFYHLLQLVRAPLLGHMPTMGDWTWGIGIFVVSAAVAFLALAKFRTRVVFWV